MSEQKDKRKSNRNDQKAKEAKQKNKHVFEGYASYLFKITVSGRVVPAWPLIIVSLIFMFPVGFVLLMMKLILDSDGYSTLGKVAIGFGVLLLYFGIVEPYTSYGYLPLTTSESWTGTVVGVLLIWYGRRKYLVAKLWEQYQDAIFRTDDGSIQDIAKELGLTYEKTKEDIEKLIKHKLLPRSYIDEHDGKLVSPLAGMYSTTKKTPKKSAKCPNCAGVGTFYIDEQPKCPYCGSPFKWADAKRQMDEEAPLE